MDNSVKKNAVHLYVIMMVKMIAPFIVLPYLARVLSTEQYAAYTYVRAAVTFVNLFMDYGFIYSGTKRVAEHEGSKETVCRLMSSITGTKMIMLVLVLLLSASGFCFNTLTQEFYLFSICIVAAACIQNLLPDYVFRGIENIKPLSICVLTTRAATTLMLFLFVKGENDLIIVAILEMLYAVISVAVAFCILKKEGYVISAIPRPEDIIEEIKGGFNFFVITVAPSLYGALNTILIGNWMSAEEIIYWGTGWNVVSAALSLCLPLSNAVFPAVIKQRNIAMIKKTVRIMIPALLLMTVILAACSKPVYAVLAGQKYVDGYYVLQVLSPVVFLGYISIMIGTPVLGAIGADKALKNIIIIIAVFHVVGMCSLYLSGMKQLVWFCVLRCMTELLGLILKIIYINRSREYMRLHGWIC